MWGRAEVMKTLRENSGFRREGEENCALMGYYAACKWRFLTDVFRQPIGSVFNDQEPSKFKNS